MPHPSDSIPPVPADPVERTGERTGNRTGKRRRVAVVYPFFPHYRGAVMTALHRSPEHDYLFVGDRTSPFGTVESWAIPPEIPFVYAPSKAVGGPFLIQWGLVRLALRRDLDTIIYHMGVHWVSIWLSAAVARLTGKRVLNWTHGWTRPQRGITGWIRRALYLVPHEFLLYGHLGKVLGLREGVGAERLHVIYNSLDYPEQVRAREEVTDADLAEARAEAFEHPERPMLICISRLTEFRRLDLLLEAMGRLKAAGREVNLMLVGDGPARADLEAMAARMGLSVHFYGACYDESVLAKLVMAAAVTVSPGPVGLTAMHSLAFGTPVITHADPYAQMPESEAIIPGRNGGLFRPDDPDDLARAIGEWTGAGVDRHAVREACHRIIDRFYNPEFQRRVIDRAVSGRPADDLFWMKPDAARS